MRGIRAIVSMLALSSGCARHGRDGDAPRATTPSATESSVASTALHAPAATSPAAPEPYRFVGRFLRQGDGGLRFAWSGSRVETRFAGTAMDVDLEDPGTNSFEAVLDGVPVSRLRAGPGRKTLHAVVGAPLGEHTLAVVRRTEAMIGESVFHGFVAPEGTRILGATKPASRLIELVGDSITAGLGMEGEDPCAPPRDSQDSYLTYGEVAARALGADVVNISWSGVRGAGRSPTMADLYPLALPHDASSTWTPAGPPPDAVVVNLGDNDDFWSAGAADRFHDDFVRFVESVRARYPKALVACTTGPMSTGSSEAARATIAKAVRTLADARVFYLEFSPIDARTEGLGCGSHPTVKTHARMAETLRAELAKRLGW